MTDSTPGNGLEQYDTEELVKNFLKCRAAKETLAKQQTAAMKPISDVMNVITAELQRRLQADKEQSKRTKYGTAFLKDVDSVTVADWAVTLPFIIANGLWSLLTAALNKTAVKEYMKAHKEDAAGPLPPGSKYTSVVVCQVRSAGDVD